MASVELIASPAAGGATGSNDNSALRLASSLAGVNQALAPVLDNIATEGQRKAAAKANADALANSGKAFGDAVRDGKIERTQNPWYIRAYEEGAATIRARGEVSSLLEEAQTFASKNDSKAFQAEFSQRLGDLAKNYTGPDQAAGFQAAAQPLAAQAVQQNVQYNVARINEEHTQNVSTETTSAILAAKTAAGGKPSPAQVYAAMQKQHDEWIATGGHESDWNQIAINSTIGAAFNSGDATLLDVLDDPRGGKGPLSNIAGPDGQPIAQTLATARYRIEQAAEGRATQEIRAEQNKVKLEGIHAENDLYGKFGYDILNGTVNSEDVKAFLLEKGYSAQAAAVAVHSVGSAVADNQALTRALMGGDPETFALYSRARTQGMTPGLQMELSERVRKGQMTVQEADSFLSAAQSRSDHLDSEARADHRAAVSDARAAATADRVLTTSQAKSLKTHREQMAGTVAMRLANAGIKSLNNPKARKSFEQSLEDAESAYTFGHPGDIAGARLAVETQAAAYVTQQTSRHKAPARPGSSANPNR